MNRPLVIACLSTASLVAQTADLFPVADAGLFEDANGAIADGTGAHLYVGRTNAAGNYGARRGLLRFDVVGAVPPGFEIVSAALRLHQSSFNGNPTIVTMHRVVSPWSEGPTNAGSPGGGGAPAVPGDVTWTHAHSPTVPWTAAGGDFIAAPLASTHVVNPGFYTFGPSATLTTSVRDMRANPGLDFGWLLKTTDEALGVAKRFDSRENVGFEPVLSPVFAPAFPAAVMTFGAGCTFGAGLPFRWSTFGPPVIGDSEFAVGLSSGPAFGAATIFLAQGPGAPTSLPGGCTVWLDSVSVAAFVAAGVSPLGPLPLDAAGSVIIPLPIIPDPTLVGLMIAGQAVAPAANPSGFVLSDGLLLTFGV